MSNMNEKKSLIVIVSSILLMTSFEARAQWWNPLAPKDFEDCVIKNLKSGMGEDAVRALRSACRAKFPTKESAAEKLEAQKKDARYLKCNEENKIDLDHRFIAIGRANQIKTNEILSNLKSIKFDQSGAAPFVNFQNMNSFGISGVMIGLTKDKSCPRKIEDYIYTTYCTQGNTEKGVSGGSFGGLSCGWLPKEAKNIGFCPIGFSPMYNRFDDSLLTFQENNGYCN